MTFAADRIVRDNRGMPMGRCVFKVNFKYVTGMPEIPIALCEFPKVYVKDPRGMTFYIEKIPYYVPKDLSDVRINRADPLKIVINNFAFIRATQ